MYSPSLILGGAKSHSCAWKKPEEKVKRLKGDTSEKKDIWEYDLGAISMSKKPESVRNLQSEGPPKN